LLQLKLKQPVNVNRLFLTGFASARTSTDFAAERDLRPGADVAWEPLATSTGVDAAGDDISGVACAFGLRPSPRAFANVERRSE